MGGSAMKYLKPNAMGHGYAFTRDKLYRIVNEFPYSRFEIEDDNGNKQIVRADGQNSARLYNGQFEIVDIPEPAEAIKAVVTTIASKAYKEATEDATGKGWMINKGGFMDRMVIVKPEKAESEAEKKLRQIEKILRTPDGFDVVKQAEVVRKLADVLLALQGQK